MGRYSLNIYLKYALYMGVIYIYHVDNLISLGLNPRVNIMIKSHDFA